ncbi:MAG: InlB B-repeat-containing protein, partial [Coriobacteriales bacterium]|nr:InlB B-repeat-containing protein [Coriobacteriales bacterium]
AIAADLEQNGPVEATITHAYTLTIDASACSSLKARAGQLHMKIENTGGANITFKQLNLVGIAPDRTGGLWLSGGSFAFENSTFSDMRATALDVQGDGADLKVTDCRFTELSSGIVMAGSTVANRTLTILNSTFSENTAASVRSDKATLRLEGTEFSANKDTTLECGGPATIEGCDFLNNAGSDIADRSGAISFMSGAKAKVLESSFVGNYNTRGGGGAVRIASSCDVEMERCYFTGNYITANAQGGAVYATGITYTNITIRDSLFDGNQARNTGMLSTNSDGGAFAVRNNWGGSSQVVIQGTTFVNNTSGDDGGALLLEGGITGKRLTASISNCTFAHNYCKGAYGSGFKLNGSGGAIQFYGMTDSEITNCTFYDNECTRSTSNAGGGAVALDTQQGALPPSPPVLSNNIFIANKGYPANKANVFIVTEQDAGAKVNNGNVGYDNGMADYSQGENPSAYITKTNVFADRDADGNPVEEHYGVPVGSPKNSATRFVYIPSPLTDEMYRDGSGPYYDASVRLDARGYPRDHFPNAGAAEIYWTKFDPGINEEGFWTTPPPRGIASLKSTEIYYLVTNPPPDNQLVTFPRFTIDTKRSNFGFQGWQSDQPEDPTIDPSQFTYPLVQPSITVTSTKQTYTAKWVQDRFRVDFDLQYDGKWGTPRIDVPLSNTISEPAIDLRPGYTFDGWFAEPECVNQWDFSRFAIRKDTILYAKWTQLTPPVPPVDPPDCGTCEPCVSCTCAPCTCPEHVGTPCTQPGHTNTPCTRPPSKGSLSPKGRPSNTARHTLSALPGASMLPSAPSAPSASAAATSNESAKSADNAAKPQSKVEGTSKQETTETPASAKRVGQWSLFNLVLSLLDLFIVFALIIHLGFSILRSEKLEEDAWKRANESREPSDTQQLSARYDEETDEPEALFGAGRESMAFSRLCTGICVSLALASLIIFFIVEKLDTPMVIFDAFSPLFGILFVLVVLGAILSLLNKSKPPKREEEQEEEHPLPNDFHITD